MSRDKGKGAGLRKPPAPSTKFSNTGRGKPKGREPAHRFTRSIEDEPIVYINSDEDVLDKAQDDDFQDFVVNDKDDLTDFLSHGSGEEQEDEGDSPHE